MLSRRAARKCGSFFASVMRIFTLLFLATCAVAEDRTLTFTWEASPSTNVEYYNLYIGTMSGQYPIKMKVYGTAMAVDLPIGIVHYAIVTAVDSSGAESGPSNLYVFQVARPGEAVPPSSPNGLKSL